MAGPAPIPTAPVEGHLPTPPVKSDGGAQVNLEIEGTNQTAYALRAGPNVTITKVGNAFEIAADASNAIAHPLVVNVIDYYESADGAPTVDGHTTWNIGPAFGRAYAATVGAHKHLTLWIPPCDAYGVEAWSWEEPQNINVIDDDLFTLAIIGSGQSGIVIPTQFGGVDDKLLLHGGGPSGQPCRVSFSDLFFAGDSTKAADCTTLILTTTDMSVLIDRCFFYGLQAAGEALLALECDNVAMQDSQLMGCGNSGFDTAALVYVRSGIFGILFKRVFFYPSEHLDNSLNIVNPWGGPGYEKNSTAPTWDVWLRGDDPSHPPFAKFEQCIFGGYGYGGVWGNPDVGLAVQSVSFDQCTVRDQKFRTILAVHDITTGWTQPRTLVSAAVLDVAVTIDDNMTAIYNGIPSGWTLAASAPGGLVLRINFTGNAGNIDGYAEVRVREVQST